MLPMPNDARLVDAFDDAAYQRLDKRGSQSPVPDPLETYLTDFQLISLMQLRDFGWSLAFVRRPLFERPTVVMFNMDDQRYAVLDDDGGLDLEPNLDIRTYLN